MMCQHWIRKGSMPAIQFRFPISSNMMENLQNQSLYTFSMWTIAIYYLHIKIYDLKNLLKRKAVSTEMWNTFTWIHWLKWFLNFLHWIMAVYHNMANRCVPVQSHQCWFNSGLFYYQFLKDSLCLIPIIFDLSLAVSKSHHTIMFTTAAELVWHVLKFDCDSKASWSKLKLNSDQNSNSSDRLPVRWSMFVKIVGHWRPNSGSGIKP